MSTIKSIIKESHNKDFSWDKYKEKTIKELKSINNLNACISLVEDAKNKSETKTSLLNNICCALKDNINFFGTKTTGGSLFLKNYVSPYSATIAQLLENAGAIIVAKTNMDEFGLGGDGIYSGYGDVINPFDETRITGGSSSGSAVLVAKKIVPFAIGTDTGDSVRRPASLLGIYGYKPTYGLISRYGVLPYAPSLDHVALFSNSIEDLCIVSDVLVQHDEKDFTSQKLEAFEFHKNFLEFDFKKIDGFKFCVIKNIIDIAPKEIQKKFYDYLNTLNIKYDLIELDLNLMKLIPLIYKVISYSEAVSCYQNLTGITFGQKSDSKNFEKKVRESRSETLGFELKKRFVFGAFCTSKENYESVFLKASSIRQKIVNQVLDVFKKYDSIIMLGSSDVAPLVEDVKSKKPTTSLVDDYLQIANFGGLPSLTIPGLKIGGNFVGINLCMDLNRDKELLYLGEAFVRSSERDVKND